MMIVRAVISLGLWVLHMRDIERIPTLIVLCTLGEIAAAPSRILLTCQIMMRIKSIIA